MPRFASDMLKYIFLDETYYILTEILRKWVLINSVDPKLKLVEVPIINGPNDDPVHWRLSDRSIVNNHDINNYMY